MIGGYVTSSMAPRYPNGVGRASPSGRLAAMGPDSQFVAETDGSALDVAFLSLGMAFLAFLLWLVSRNIEAREFATASDLSRRMMQCPADGDRAVQRRL